MGDCIDRNKAINALEYNDKVLHYFDLDKENIVTETVASLCKVLCEMPSADIQPIQWVSCKDKMPDTSEQGLGTMYSDCCLVCDSDGWCGMAYYLTDSQKSWWEFADAQNKIKIDWTEITHWIPISELLKGVEHNG